MPGAASNVPVYTVSQISGDVKRTLEERFERVRIRGEVSRTTLARSGHFYLALKDERAVIDAVAWKGVAARFPFQVTEGMDLIATGKVTAYPGQSKYQLIIDQVELAGEGALLKLLEDRRRALMTEGLFDAARKQPLPLLPRRLGVVSSPNGAVIRDIWHRVQDRFPLPVLLWPVLVQGPTAAGQVARAIAGFTTLPADQRPDALIVARGGGSLEDLWAFNEEEVVRAAAACPIPLISAIGHETDTTLLDYVADRRAPTPTAAAEFAVPVRSDLLHTVQDQDQRLVRGVEAQMRMARQGLDDVSRALTDPHTLLQRAAQDLDTTLARVQQSAHAIPRQIALHLRQVAVALPVPSQTLRAKADTLRGLSALPRFHQACTRQLVQAAQLIDGLFGQLQAHHRAREALRARGWVTVQDAYGQTLTHAAEIQEDQPYALHFHDGPAHVIGAATPPAASR